MIQIYCNAHHQFYGTGLCEACQQLFEYASARLDHCRFGEKKPTCKKCPIHCYKSVMKEYMKSVMRYAGPRMILKHPHIALQHFIH